MAADLDNGRYQAPDVSRELIPVVVDRVARESPKATFITLCTGERLEPITYRQYANAVDNTARWLEHELGKSDRNEALAYFGTGGGDICYAILLVAAVKIGHHMLFNSPRNSVDAHVRLLTSQRCATVILPEPRPPYVNDILAAHPMRTLLLPKLKELLNRRGPPLEFVKTFEQARRDPVVSLHTSGSTGFPKPIVWTQGSVAVAANAYQAPVPGDKVPTGQLYRSILALSAMPMFHAAGLIINVLGPLYSRHNIALPPPGPLLTADDAASLIRITRADVAMLPPSTLDEIGKRSDLAETLTSLKYVMAAGGVVTKAAGDAIIRKTRMLNILGTTEFGAFSQIPVDPEDWAYLQFSPNAGIEFRHCSGEEHELVVVRDERLERYQPCFEIFPELQEISSHDLFVKHPSKDNLWLYQGRSDDVIGFLNGEKTNPVLMEKLISGRPEVRDALVVGQGRFEAALLIEPSSAHDLSAKERAMLIEILWPSIEEANNQCPAFARVSKSHILFTTTGKPMSRASKGTVQRRFTVADYTAEIDALYADADSLRARDAQSDLDLNDLQGSILTCLISTTGFKDLKLDDDFFARGMDSLQVLQSARNLKSGLENANLDAKGLAPSTLYLNPSVTRLSAAIESMRLENQVSKDASEEHRMTTMSKVLNEYSVTLEARERQCLPLTETTQVVALTGSTGSLGSYLLDSLLSNKAISKIYCLNRSIDAEQKQKQINQARGLSTRWDDQRVVFLTANLAEKDLGLGDDRYTELVTSTDLIIHNAWQVNFHLSLDSFKEVHIQGVRNIIHWSLHSDRQARIFFISSISAVMNWSAQHEGAVPEMVFDDFSIPPAIGYGESKYIAERLLAHVNTKYRIPVSICRVGQIAGPVHSSKGAWHQHEWLPSLIKSSQHLGILPDSLGKLNRVDWIPIDLLGGILTDLALLPLCTSRPRIFHVINPHITTWSALLPGVKTTLRSRTQIVPLATWVQVLRSKAAGSITAQELEANPALKLIDFYEDMLDTRKPLPRLETAKTTEASPALMDVGPITEAWVKGWMAQWGIGNS